MSEPAAAHRASVHRCRPYPPRLHALEQYFLGLQHGPDAAEVYVLDGGPDRRCPGGLLRRRAVNAAQQQRASGGSGTHFGRRREQRSLCGY